MPHLDHRLEHGLDHGLISFPSPRPRLRPAQAVEPSGPPRRLGPGRTVCESLRGLLSHAATLATTSVSVNVSTGAGVE
jgi:hypothetical protein